MRYNDGSSLIVYAQLLYANEKIHIILILFASFSRPRIPRKLQKFDGGEKILF
jgi:hypothetical protein